LHIVAWGVLTKALETKVPVQRSLLVSISPDVKCKNIVLIDVEELFQYSWVHKI